MLLRNRVYAPYGVIGAFDGLTTATIDGLPDAVTRFLLSPAGRSLRDHPALRASDDALPAVVRSTVERLAPGATPQDLIVRAFERTQGAHARPLAIVCTDTAMAIRVPHSDMDGRGALEFFRFVVDTAAGEPGTLDLRPSPRLPYLRMLAKHLRPAAVRAYRGEQAGTAQGPAAPTPTADDLALGTARFESLVLSEDEAARLGALDRRGTSSSARLGSLALGTLRRVYRGTEDIPVQIPVDLRRWAPPGRIDGNFISVAPLGSLLGTDWSPTELSARLREAVRAHTPIVRSLHAILWHVSRAPHRWLRRTAGRPPVPARLGISVSMLTDPVDYADAAWLPDVPRLVGAATVGPWPSSTFVSIVQSASRVRITAWDETGLFDLDRFREALNDELGALLTASRPA